MLLPVYLAVGLLALDIVWFLKPPSKTFNQSPWKHFFLLFLCSGGPAARVPAPSASPQSSRNLFHLFHLFFSSVLHSGHFLNLNLTLYLLSPFLSCDGSALTIIKDDLNLYFRSYICFNSRHVLVWILAHLDMYFFLIIIRLIVCLMVVCCESRNNTSEGLYAEEEVVSGKV